MKELQFIQVAQHAPRIKKIIRNLVLLTLVSILVIIVSRFFYEGRVHEAIVYRRGMRLNVEVGWPANINAIASWGLLFFSLAFLYLFFRQDLKKPALAVTNEGLFINQQLFRNAFIPWSEIERVELRGHISNPIMRLFFKDTNAVLKGQVFILKSIANATLKSNPSMGISKDETIGDLVSMFDFMKEKGVPVKEQMAGRSKNEN
ncbi:STM3941 family protein [Flavobacterium chungnamense]|uniref:PH domain-containing protein n=1 Tax=Flavobacterium chungnamense TaxID=706182 RepID=A0ABP7UK46_9FLAO